MIRNKFLTYVSNFDRPFVGGSSFIFGWCVKRISGARILSFFTKRDALILASARFYPKTTGGSQQNSKPSSRASVFREGQYAPGGSRIPIYEQRGSRAHHLAVKDAEWNGPAVREGLFIATLLYIQSGGIWSFGSKLGTPKNNSGRMRRCDRRKRAPKSRSIMV